MKKKGTTKKTTSRKAHPPRTPFGGPRLKLHIDKAKCPKLNNFHICWVSEHLTEEYKEAGYTHVSRDELGTATVGEQDIGHGTTDAGMNVSRQTARDGQRSYLMKLPEKFHQQDQEALEAANQQVDDAIYGGDIDNVDPGHRQKRPEHRMSVRNRG